MELAKALKPFLCLLLLLQWLCFPIRSSSSATFSQGEEEYKYGFIKRASTFSSSSSAGDDGWYDYIVVGGGTAGCPLAATLSDKYRVLVLERGGVPFDNYNVSYMHNFHITLADTSSTSPSQCFISTDGVFNSRARILGGATCINAGFYTRASSSSGLST